MIPAASRLAAAWADLRPPERSPGEVRDAIGEVLARPEFQRPKPGWVQRLREAVVDLIERALGNLLGGGRGTFIAWVILGVAIIAAVLVATRFARGVTRDPGRGVSTTTVPRRGAAEWRADAEAAERAGQWRQALRCRYRALVAELADRGLVEEVAGRTAGEYRTEMEGTAPAVAAPFAGATDLFERAWYGEWPTGQDDAQRIRDLSDEVLAGVGR
ncbi:MAG TPA: DUF4129 domain-containing protein [Acidimicrobiales bacterium]